MTAGGEGRVGKAHLVKGTELLAFPHGAPDKALGELELLHQRRLDGAYRRRHLLEAIMG